MHHLQYLRRRGISMEISSHCSDSIRSLGKRCTRQARVACHRAQLSSIVATSRLNDVKPVANFAETLTAVINGYAQIQIEDLIPVHSERRQARVVGGLVTRLHGTEKTADWALATYRTYLASSRIATIVGLTGVPSTRQPHATDHVRPFAHRSAAISNDPAHVPIDEDLGAARRSSRLARGVRT